MAKYWRSKTILAKLETTYGVDATPTGAANAMLVSEVTFAPMDGEDVPRNLERTFFGAQTSLPVGLRSVLTFSVELVGSGTAGTAPAWAPLLRACGAAQVVTAGTKVEYTPVTDNPESASIYFDIDGTKHVLLGSRGTWVYRLNAQGIPVLVFTFTGLFSAPAEAAKPTPVYTGFLPPQIASTANTPTFTVGGVPMKLRTFEVALNNAITPRLLIGYQGILITDRNETMTAQVEAEALTVYNPYTLAQAATSQAVVLAHGTVAGRRVRFDAPYAVQQRLTGLEDQDGIMEWPLSFSLQPSAGNDQWKITLD
jgi:hypothetical protein